MSEKLRKLTQRQHDIQTQNNGALEKMLRGVITEKAYSNFVEPTTRELEQIEVQLEQLQKQRVTLEELTEQVKAEAIDLAGTWERGSFETKLDLQRSLFGRYLYFEPETVDPFLNQKNILLSERLRLHFAEYEPDTYISEGWVSESMDENEEAGQVGVPDGI
jgi:hypothetical protein